MRKLIVACLLFQAVSAFAQTIGSEIESGPLPSPTFPALFAAPSVLLAKDRTGVAIAWMMPDGIGDRISVVRLDGTGHFTGQVQTIPIFSSEPVYVIGPSIAAVPNGDGFTLAWLEIVSPPAITRAVYCRLDRDLKPSTPSMLLTITQPITAPAIVRSGRTIWITAGTFAWQLRDDGTLGEALNAGVNATDMTVATDFPQIVGRDQLSNSTFTCDRLPGCSVAAGGPFRGFCSESCRNFQHPYTLRFTSLYSVSASKAVPFDSDAAPAIHGDGRDVALVWFEGARATGGSVVMSRLSPPSFTDFQTSVNQSRVIGSFGPDAGATRSDIASDGERYVVVWRTQTTDRSHDIVGASIDRAGNVIPLSIATSVAEERDPSVISLGEGTFLVAYEKFIAGERRIAGRFVTFATRTRAVR